MQIAMTINRPSRKRLRIALSFAISCVSMLHAAGPADCFAQQITPRSSPPLRSDAPAFELGAPVNEPSFDTTQPSDPAAKPGAAVAEPLPAPVGVAESEPAMPDRKSVV